VSAPVGPGQPFELLFDDDTQAGTSLPPAFQSVYGGDWRIPAAAADRPYTYVNFVTSRDGRVSFNEPGHLSGADVSRFSTHDRWLMGLLRARADAILVGDNTLRLEPKHRWTARYIYPEDALAFDALTAAEGRARAPLQVFLSLDGDLSPDSVVFTDGDLRVIVATTRHGAANARSRLERYPDVEVLALGEAGVDVPELMALLRQRDGVQALLCEGGPRVYGSVLAAGSIDEEFLTLSPVVIGNPPADGRPPRPGLIEGVAFAPDNPPILRPVSLRRAGDLLFMRSRRSLLR